MLCLPVGGLPATGRGRPGDRILRPVLRRRPPAVHHPRGPGKHLVHGHLAYPLFLRHGERYVVGRISRGVVSGVGKALGSRGDPRLRRLLPPGRMDPPSRPDDRGPGSAARGRRRAVGTLLHGQSGFHGAGGVRRRSDGAVSARRSGVHNRRISVASLRSARPETPSASTAAAASVHLADDWSRRQRRTQTREADGEDRPVLGVVRPVNKCPTRVSLLPTAPCGHVAPGSQGTVPVIVRLSGRLSEGDHSCHFVLHLSRYLLLSR